MFDSMFFAAFDVLIKILESYRPQIPIERQDDDKDREAVRGREWNWK